ncbi:MAG: DUF4239 domain-containing protein [Planctomycetes bacterium]|nr:DUF4239 domain-containing protein [Planctomycetota bacterium]
MFDWIYTISSLRFAILTCGFFVAFSWVGTIIARPILRSFVKHRESVNDLVGYVLSCFGVFYGLLLGLLAVAAYQNFRDVENVVSSEASSLSALATDVSAYPEPERKNLVWLLRDYTRDLIKISWPNQQKGIVSKEGNFAMSAFHERLLKFEPQTAGQEIMHAETLKQYNNYLEKRQMRLLAISTSIPEIMWIVVLVGAMMNITLVWLFDMRLMSHLFLGGMLACFLGMMIFLIASMDKPFRGDVSISPEPFKQIHTRLLEE